MRVSVKKPEDRNLYEFTDGGNSCKILNPEPPRYWYNYLWNEDRYWEDAVPGTLTIFSHRMTIVRVLGSEFLLYHFGIKAVIISKYHRDTN